MQISRQESAGTTVFIIKDPVTGKFFRLKETEFYIAGSFDGEGDFASIAEKTSRKFNVKIESLQIELFAAQLLKAGILLDATGESQQPIDKPRHSLLGRLLFIKLKAINPEKFIEKTYRLARPFYSNLALKSYVIIGFFAIIITIANIDEMLLQARDFFRPEIIPLAWITIFFVTLIHELSHTYSCRLHGGKVTDMGFLLLYFQPCFYSNVSDAYLFPDRKKRLAVTSAGIISQVVVWALAVFIWRLTSPDNLINSTAFIIIALSFVGITFNLNPLLKLDGYYFLVDYWEIPNLRRNAFRYIRQSLLGTVPGDEIIQADQRQRKIFIYYGSASLVYSAVLIGYIAYRLGLVANRQFGSFGLVFFLAILLYFMFDAMKKGKIFQLAYNQRGAILRPGRLMIAGAIVIVLLAVSIFIKLPLRLTNDSLVMPFEQVSLRSSSPGSAELLIERTNEDRILKQFQLVGQDYSVLSIVPALKVGDLVSPGDLLASIKSNVYEAERLERYANLERAKKQLDLLEKGPQTEEIKQTQDVISQARLKLEKASQDLNRAESLYARGIIPEDQYEDKKTTFQILKSELDFYENQLVLLKRGARPEEIDMARAQVNQLEARLGHLTSQLEQSAIESPIAGIVIQVNNGDVIITIARTDTVRVRINVPEKEISAIAVGNPVKMKVRSYPGITYSGLVTKIDPLVVYDKEGRPVFWVTAYVPNGDGLLKAGMTGKSKINCGKWPIYKIVLWRLVRFLRIEFWSWW